jgi:molybdopterin/thiamine biosynthesis adenylyltransferase
MLTPYQADRYSRQILCERIGVEGQAGICRGHVAVTGLGATGSAAVNMLARAGVGTLTLIDPDRVEFNNLQRQTLYNEAHAQAATLKALAAAEAVRAINSSIQVRAVAERLTAHNAERLLADADVIVDNVDDFHTRYLVNDVACKLGIPYIYGAVLGSYGVTMTILPGRTPCLQCLFPQPPQAWDTAATRGVLASVVNVIAALQVVEALKILMGRAEEACRGLFQIDVWDRSVSVVEVASLPECPSCQRRQFRFLHPEK